MLSPKQIRAARYYAEGWLNKRQFCKKLDISRSTLHEWLKLKEFTDQVAEFRAEYVKRVKCEGVASLENRIRIYNQMQTRIRQLIAARAKDLKDVPGGKTGLLVRQYKSIGSGEFAEKVEEYTADTALLKELREQLMQAARELGQIDKASNADESPDRVIRVRPKKKKDADDGN